MKKKLFSGFNFVKKKITEVTQTAVNSAVNLLEDNQSGDYLKDLYIALHNKQLYIDQETYNKNYIPLNKYYKPEPQTSNPILYIAVISFNQKKRSHSRIYISGYRNIKINRRIKFIFIFFM